MDTCSPRKADLLQTVDGADMQVQSGSEVRHHSERPHPQGQREQPASPGAKVEMDKSQTAGDSKAMSQMRPPNRPPEHFRGAGLIVTSSAIARPITPSTMTEKHKLAR